MHQYQNPEFYNNQTMTNDQDSQQNQAKLLLANKKISQGTNLPTNTNVSTRIDFEDSKYQHQFSVSPPSFMQNDQSLSLDNTGTGVGH